MNDSTWTLIFATTNIQGFYGEKGHASTTNVPTCREDSVGWYDSIAQEFWMFGGKFLGQYSAYNLRRVMTLTRN